MVVGKNPGDSLPPALWAAGTGGTGELDVQSPLQRRWDQTQGRCKPKHSALVPESLTGTQAPSGNHGTLLFLRTNSQQFLPPVTHTESKQGVLYCPIVWYRNGLCTPFRDGNKISFDPPFCGLSSGWDQTLFNGLFLSSVEHIPDLQCL